VFQQQTVEDIVKKILKEHGIKKGKKGDGTLKWDFQVKNSLFY